MQHGSARPTAEPSGSADPAQARSLHRNRDLESGLQREHGYRASLAAAGVPFDLVRAGGYCATDLQDADCALLELPRPPTAIFTANDVSAIATIDVALTLGLDVPRDLSVVGFDDVPESALAGRP